MTMPMSLSKHDSYSIHYPHTLDSQLLDVFSKLLEKDPTQRVTLKEIKVR